MEREEIRVIKEERTVEREGLISKELVLNISSIGSFSESWLSSIFQSFLGKTEKKEKIESDNLKIIFPSKEFVENSFSKTFQKNSKKENYGLFLKSNNLNKPFLRSLLRQYEPSPSRKVFVLLFFSFCY